ncbi:MAG: helix-turn-helix domain-containing protein [Suipraeoptans sp.]
MTVGDKIRYIRNLKKMTQKKLGIDSGFSSATADVRIRQYESNKMIPKADKLADIARALDVDISALSDINITSRKEVMQILFEFEKMLGISLKKENNTFSLVFDNLEKIDREIFFYLDSWYEAMQKNKLKTKNSDDYESHLEYLIWKSRFPFDLQKHELEMQTQISEKFSAIKDNIAKTSSPIETVKDFALLLESMVRNRIDMLFSYVLVGIGSRISIISFSDFQLLNLGTHESELFASFLYSMETLKKAGIMIEEQKHTYEGETFSDYLIHSSPLGSLLSSIQELRTHIDKGNEDEYIDEYIDILQNYDIKITSIL